MSRNIIDPAFVPWKHVASGLGLVTLKALRGLAEAGDFPWPHKIAGHVYYLQAEVDAWFVALRAGRLGTRWGANTTRAALKRRKAPPPVANSPFPLIDAQEAYEPPPQLPLPKPRPRPAAPRVSNRARAGRAKPSRA